MFSRAALGSTVAVATAAAFGAAAQAAGPPPPTSTNGNAVELVASGLGTPTGFAFGAGTVFESDNGGMDASGKPIAPRGGVYVLKNGTATLVPGSPPISFGIVWRKGTLYVSAGRRILAWSGWNGTSFSKHRVVYTAPKKFNGFNGLAFGANGRLYAGADTGNPAKFDHGPPTTPFEYDLMSFNPKGGGLKIVARGIRQPWQMAFPAGSSSPYVSNLGQDSGAKNPPDFVLRVKRGQDYGFPKCNWTKKKACKGFAKPFKFFSPHTDVMGLGLAGGRLYMSEFVGNKGQTGLVASMPAGGGKPTTLLSGFAAPVVGLGVNGGYVYVGELTGQAFRVKL